MRRRLHLLWQWLKLEQARLYKILLLILIISLAFALGYIFASEEQRASIIIDKTVTNH